MGAALAGVAAAGVAALLLGATGWASWLLAWRLLPSAGTSERAAGACVVAYGGLYGLFCFLLFAHAFRWWIAIPAALALAGVVHAALARRTAAREAWRRDVERARDAAAGYARSPWGLALAGAGLLGLVRVARGMVLPPMGWDALVYHLFKAARWVQLGHHSVAAAPDIWGLYEYFPGAGSSYWAWALLRDKLNTMPTFGDCELIYTNINRNSVKKYTLEWNGLLGKETTRIHPTQKPVKLYEWLLKNYAKKGDKILDTHLGSGSIYCLI